MKNITLLSDVIRAIVTYYPGSPNHEIFSRLNEHLSRYHGEIVSYGTFNSALHESVNSRKIKKKKIDKKPRYYSTIKQRASEEPMTIRFELDEIEKRLHRSEHGNSQEYLKELIKNLSTWKPIIENKVRLEGKMEYACFVGRLDEILDNASQKLKKLPNSYANVREINENLTLQYFSPRILCGPNFGYVHTTQENNVVMKCPHGYIDGCVICSSSYS